MTTEEVKDCLPVVMFALVDQVLVDGSYSSLVLKREPLYHPIQYILLLTTEEVKPYLAVVMFALVGQVLGAIPVLR